MRTLLTWLVSAIVAVGLTAAPAAAQAVAGFEQARPVEGDPGIFSMLVTEGAPFRVLRDYAEPGATRRMHAHATATYHVFVLITGRLSLTIEGQNPVEVGPGEVVSIPGGANHTFVNLGEVTATIVEVFGRDEGSPRPTPLAEGTTRWQGADIVEGT